MKKERTYKSTMTGLREKNKLMTEMYLEEHERLLRMTELYELLQEHYYKVCAFKVTEVINSLHAQEDKRVV